MCDATAGIFTNSNDLSGQAREFLQPLRKLALDGYKAWVFNPHLYKRLSNHQKWDIDFGARVTSPVLEQMCLRRRQRSPLIHADGKVT